MQNNKHFIFIGPQRCGTTFFYDWIKSENKLNFTAHVKEGNFFAVCCEYDEYLENFTKNSANIFVEICPKYFYNIDARRRIADQVPNCKIVFVYRNSLERLTSYYFHEKRKGRTNQSLATWCLQNYKTLGVQFDVMNDWINLFGIENFLLINFAELDNLHNVIMRLDSFGLPLDANYAPKSKVNSASKNNYPIIGKVASGMVTSARDLNLHFFVNLLKRIPYLKSFLFGKDIEIDYSSALQTIDEQIIECLTEDARKIEKVENEIDIHRQQ